jgi:hypothetical protein
VACTAQPTELDICRTRGDTFPIDVLIKQADGTPLNITGASFLLTVDPAPDPISPADNIFQLVGVITDGPGGAVRFTLSALQADQVPNTYFYDLQMTDASTAIRTVARGAFSFDQDVTK